MLDEGEAFQVALSKSWLTTVSGGYCSTDARPVEDQTAILVDVGLIRAVEATAPLISQHYQDPEFTNEPCGPEQRAAFARAHVTFLGQYFLYGRAHTPLGIRSATPQLDGRIAREGLMFVLAHEIGHVIAGHSPSGDHSAWLQPQNIPADLHAFAAEIEADALGLQLVLGDMWGQKTSSAEADARLFAIQAVLQTFETVEACALIPVNRRHLPAKRRWEGILNALLRWFDTPFLTRHEELWNVISPSLRFTVSADLTPPPGTISEELHASGWAPVVPTPATLFNPSSDKNAPRVIDIDETWLAWDELEEAVRHYRLPLPVLEALVGYEAGLITDPDHEMGPTSHTLGHAAVADLIQGLPRWLVSADPLRGSASSGDLIEHLRHRDLWPEPFCSTSEGVLPIHTMASAVRQTLSRLHASEPS